MSEFDDDLYSLPVSGHYDCGYSYGSTIERPPAQEAPRQALPQQILATRSRNPMYGTIDDRKPSYLQNTRPRSPPTVLPLSFSTRPTVATGTYTIPEEGAPLPDHYRQDSAVASPIALAITTTTSQPLDYYYNKTVENPPPVPPKSHARSQHEPPAPRYVGLLRQDLGSDSDLSTLSTRSRQASTQSAETTGTSASIVSQSTPITPDPLPSHSNPQYLSPTQSVAFSGPRPARPMRLRRRDLCDAQSGAVIFQLSDETKLKLSQQAIYQVYEAGSTSTIGTLGYSIDVDGEVAVILRGQDVVLRRETPSSNRWCFKPSILTKKGAFWYWSRDKSRGDIILSDARKGGLTVARIQKDVLSLGRTGLSIDTVNEICLAAMALAELARRSKEYEDAPNLATAIAIIALGEAINEQAGDEDDEPMKQPKRRLTFNRR